MDCMIMYSTFFHRRNKAQRSDLAHGSGFFYYFGLWVALTDMPLFCKTIDLISVTIVSGIEYPCRTLHFLFLIILCNFSNLFRQGKVSIANVPTKRNATGLRARNAQRQFEGEAILCLG
jgi:hypothetical protein